MSIPALPAALFAVALCFAAPALADTPQPPSTAEEDAPAQALNPPADDGELASFVNAFVRLIGVQHGYMMMLQNEPDPAKRAELKAGAYGDMKDAVERDGMSVERYNEIAQALRSDTGLQDRVQGMLQQMAQSPEE
ncbi:MAG: DUF4168 domain-containing protein [Actinomycetota bacterium]